MDLCASLIPKPTPPGYLFLKGLCACEDDGLMDEFAMENAGPGGTHVYSQHPIPVGGDFIPI